MKKFDSFIKSNEKFSELLAETNFYVLLYKEMSTQIGDSIFIDAIKNAVLRSIGIGVHALFDDPKGDNLSIFSLTTAVKSIDLTYGDEIKKGLDENLINNINSKYYEAYQSIKNYRHKIAAHRDKKVHLDSLQDSFPVNFENCSLLIHYAANIQEEIWQHHIPHEVSRPEMGMERGASYYEGSNADEYIQAINAALSGKYRI